MSHEVNEQIKERCYTQAVNEVYALKKDWFDNLDVKRKVFLCIQDPEKFWQDMIDAKAMVLYNNWREE